MAQQDTRLIADLLPQIVWTAGPTGEVNYLNRHWAAYAGKEVDGLGWNWQKVVQPDDLDHLMAQLHQGLATVQPFEVECRLRRADGVYRWHLARAAPVCDDKGGVMKWVGTFTDIEAQRSADEACLRLAAIVTSCDDAILGMSLEGVISSWNAAAERMFGYTAAEAIGRPIWLIVPADRFQESQRLVARVSRGECVTHFETTRLGKDGSRIEVSLTVSPIKDWQGRIIGISKILRDITQQKRAQAELRQAKEAAEQANKAKDQFLAMLSHELRTPLTPVLAVVTGLRSSQKWPEELREELEIIHRSVELEARLIDDLLDLTGIARGTLRLHREPMNVHRAVEAAIDVCGGEIASKGLKVLRRLEAAEHCVDGDAARMQQVFWNLIHNAVKFTPHRGEISIRTYNGPRPIGSAFLGQATDERAKSDPDLGLIVEVADTGIGIAPELLPRIFGAFEQGKDSNNGRFTGLGMGLAIAKSLVELHGGQIQATSPGAGQGAVFTIWLPIVKTPVLLPAQHPPVAGLSNPKLRILLVEDHESSRRILARLLRTLKHDVTVARDMKSAMKAASASHFDLLVSDLGLPDGSGLELMRHLRARCPMRGICLSGYGTEEDIRHSRAAGFAAHLVKPVSFQMLQEAIRRTVAGQTPMAQSP